MNGFKNDLTEKILGLNPHVVIEPNSFIIENNFIDQLEEKNTEISISKTFSGEGILISEDKAKGLILKGVNKKEKNFKEFLEKNITSGSIEKFKKTIF